MCQQKLKKMCSLGNETMFFFHSFVLKTKMNIATILHANFSFLQKKHYHKFWLEQTGEVLLFYTLKIYWQSKKWFEAPPIYFYVYGPACCLPTVLGLQIGTDGTSLFYVRKRMFVFLFDEHLSMTSSLYHLSWNFDFDPGLSLAVQLIVIIW